MGRLNAAKKLAFTTTLIACSCAKSKTRTKTNTIVMVCLVLHKGLNLALLYLRLLGLSEVMRLL